jgi:TorA maturation chaperone TorD
MSEAVGPGASPDLQPEDAARAGLYGLIGRLFYAPPDPNLLAEICQAPDGGEDAAAGELGDAWLALQRACRSVFPAVARQEFDTLFIGVGKAEVTPYLSGYVRDTSPERYLVQLRERLAGWGLSRKAQSGEIEDHFAGVCDVMRWLIESGQPIAVQAEFFRAFMLPCAESFFAAVQKSATAGFYKHVAKLAAAYLAVERAAFEVADSE